MINKHTEKTKMLAVKMMVVIVLTYLVTWGPKLAMKTMEVFNLEEDTFGRADNEDDEEAELDLMTVLEATCEALSYASSIFNPLIFCYYNRSFRSEMKNIFLGMKRAKCCKKSRQRIGTRVLNIPVSSRNNGVSLIYISTNNST